MADKDRETIIGPETRVSGEVRGDENILVRGRIDGRVQITELLTVEVGAIVQADVDARAVLISGVVAGSVTAVENIRLTSKARVVGDLRAPSIVIEEGAAYRGRIDMGDVEAGAATSARASRANTASANGAATRTPPRLAPPARAVTASPPPRMAPPAAASRTTAPTARPASSGASPVRPGSPPAMPRPDAAHGNAPAWAKKKQLKRR